MDLAGITFNTDDAKAVGVLVLGGSAVLWGVYKAIRMANR